LAGGRRRNVAAGFLTWRGRDRGWRRGCFSTLPDIVNHFVDFIDADIECFCELLECGFGFGAAFVGGGFIPDQRLLRLRLAKQAILVDQAEIIGGFHDALRGGLFEIGIGPERIVGNADTFDVGDAEIILRLWMAEIGGACVPVNRLFKIGRSAKALMIQNTEIVGSIGHARIGGLFEPEQCALVILFHVAVTGGVDGGEIMLGFRHAVERSLLYSFNGFREI
jgi:hypothetical protein